MAVINKLRQIVREHQYQKIYGMIVDASTANMLLTVRDALSKEENKKKFDRMLETKGGFIKLVNFGWKQVR